jgi:hypothetical protein
MERQLPSPWTGAPFRVLAERHVEARIEDYSNDENEIITQNPDDAEYSPSAFNRIVWTEIEADSFYYCTTDFGLESAAEVTCGPDGGTVPGNDAGSTTPPDAGPKPDASTEPGRTCSGGRGSWKVGDTRVSINVGGQQRQGLAGLRGELEGFFGMPSRGLSVSLLAEVAGPEELAFGAPEFRSAPVEPAVVGLEPGPGSGEIPGV